jgi:hypothetical protein
LRLQLTACVVVIAVALPAAADDAVDTTVTLFQERKQTPLGGLTVIHPQADVGIDLGANASLSVGYEADVVSGATFAIYAAPRQGETVDAVSGATTFTDTRHSGHGGIVLRGRRSSLSAGYGYGTERDYRSHSVTGGASIDLPGKNTTFAISYTHNFDKVCDLDNGDATPYARRPLSHDNACFSDDAAAMTVARDIAIDTAQGTVTQNLSPTMVMQLGLHGQVIDGFQSNPYRRVRVAGADAQEAVPLIRSRGAVFARFNIFFPKVRGALGVMVRGYNDTWGIESGAAEMSYSQYMGPLLFRFRARVYRQSKAVFARDAVDYQNFGASGQYFTGDRELFAMQDALLGAKLSYVKVGEEGRQVWGVFDEIDLHLQATGIWAKTLTDTPPGGDPEGYAPDQIITQAGLMLRW